MAFSDDRTLFHYSLIVLTLIGTVSFIARMLQPSKSGRDKSKPAKGPTIPQHLAWLIMVSPSLWFTFIVFRYGRNSTNPKALLLMSPYLIHYCHRAIIYPLHLYRRASQRDDKTASGFPLAVAIMALLFNIINVYVQARFVSHYRDYESDRWFWWRFIVGFLVFAWGKRINIWGDAVLVNLKGQGGGYKIPRGGWFELVTAPHYFGEIVEWLAWAFMSWSWPGVAFFILTWANLVPTARDTHNWYLQKFGEDYPKSRKIVIPFLY